ncbi:CDP-alcohol phosphatidyltransferase family protein [bacterium]
MNLSSRLILLRILLTPIFVSLLFIDNMGSHICALFVFILATLTHISDGYFLQKNSAPSLWGQFFDPLADKILVLSALICFTVLGYIQPWMVFIIFIRDLIITILRFYAILQNQPIQTNLLAKIKTSGQIVAIQLIFIYYLFTWRLDLDQANGFLGWLHDIHLIPGIMYVITAVTIFSGIIYLIENRVLIQKAFSNLFRIFIPTDG